MTRIRPAFLRRLLTREVDLVVFSDGDVFLANGELPEKPRNILRENATARVWRWKARPRG